MKKRLLCAVLTLGMLLSLGVQSTFAAPSVCFTSVNDLLLELDPATMPVWSEGELYVSANVFEARSGAAPELGIYCSYEKRSSLALLYRSGRVLVFDLADGSAYDNASHEAVDGAALIRGERVFFPLTAVAEFFDLDYSYTKVTYGNLLRVKNESVFLSDSEFIDAAAQPMRQRYEQYARSEAASGSSGGTGGETTPSGANLTVRTLVAVTDAKLTETLMTHLASNRQQASFVFDALALEGLDDVLRRALGSGHTVVLAADGSAGADAALAALQQGNDALYRAAVSRTRFAYLTDATEATEQAVRQAGYCLVTGRDYSAVRGTQIAGRLLSAMNGRRGSVNVYIGDDARVQGFFSAYLGQLRTAGCAVSALRETQ